MSARILIVDDDSAWRRTLTRTLLDDGYVVEEAADGELALEACRLRCFDLVITDIFMPGRDGLEIVTALRRQEDRPRILAMSGSNSGGQLDFVAVARRLGADDALKKPFGPDVLRETVKALIGNGLRSVVP
jgi:two-component system response regulator ResD